MWRATRNALAATCGCGWMPLAPVFPPPNRERHNENLRRLPPRVAQRRNVLNHRRQGGRDGINAVSFPAWANFTSMNSRTRSVSQRPESVAQRRYGFFPGRFADVGLAKGSFAASGPPPFELRNLRCPTPKPGHLA